MLDEVVLASASSCSVVAPAGCGKTELVVKAIKASPPGAKSLVLTHTHAGVRALRQRLKDRKVPSRCVRVDTIAGWCLDYVLAYPKTSECSKPQPEDDNDWSAVYSGMQKVLAVQAIQRVIRASYDAIYIDEYQDCQREQHAIASLLATMLPCRVLGDPLQRIFEFAGADLSWKNDVEAVFPPIGRLTTPHRWEQTNPALGRWITLARDKLVAGEPIDLAAVPVRWEVKDEKAEGKVAKELREVEGRVIAISKDKPAAHHFARGR